MSADTYSDPSVEHTINELLIRKVDKMSPDELQELCSKIMTRFKREPDTKDIIHALLMEKISVMTIPKLQDLCVKMMERLVNEPNNDTVSNLLADVHREFNKIHA